MPQMGHTVLTTGRGAAVAATTGATTGTGTAAADGTSPGRWKAARTTRARTAPTMAAARKVMTVRTMGAHLAAGWAAGLAAGLAAVASRALRYLAGSLSKSLMQPLQQNFNSRP